jgi:hypothetical protein
METKIRKLIREVVIEIIPVNLSTGEKVSYGCDEHLNDLDSILNYLLFLRNKHKRTTAARTDYARAISRLKNQIRKAKKYAENNK